MIAECGTESDVSDTFLIPRLNCPIEPALFKSWGKLFLKQAPLKQELRLKLLAYWAWAVKVFLQDFLRYNH